MVNLFYTAPNLALYNEDILNKEAISKESIDLIVTSPPYNVGVNYEGASDSEGYNDYLLFSKQWLTNAYYWLKEEGRLALNIPLDKNKGGVQCVGADIINIAREAGFNYHSTIIWNEGNISRRTAWGSWLSASAPYIIAPVELITLFSKGNWKKSVKGVSDMTKEEFISWTLGVWDFNGESKKRVGHPAPFPRELPRRCIKLLSFVGEIVCDPFCGSGTTMIEAALNNRRFIGLEVNKEYCALAKERFIRVMREEHY